MRIWKINRKNPNKKIISLAAKVIKNGGVIIYPTDTIYGLGANALDKNAVRKIYEIKKRPENKPLSIIIEDIKMAKKYCVIGKREEEIFNCLLPGPFTLIFWTKKSARFDSIESRRGEIFTAFKNTLSVRIPDFKITSLLAKKLNTPLTATSANISGLPGSGDIKKVLKQLGIKKNKPNLPANRRIDLVLDAGVLPQNKPSTIIDLTGKKPKVVRK